MTMTYNNKNTYLIIDNKAIVYSGNELPEDKMFNYNSLALIEFFLIPIILGIPIANKLGSGSFLNIMLATFIGFVGAFIAIYLTSILPRIYMMNKFIDEHYYRTFEFNEEDIKKLNNIKKGLRFEIADLLVDNKARPTEQKTEEIHKLINERFEISTLVNRY